jgi:prephenate dehydrogenase
MWEDIFRQNKENLLEAITLFEKELYEMKNSIEKEEWEKVHKMMEDGNKLYDILEE